MPRATARKAPNSEDWNRLLYTNKMLKYLKQLNCEDDELMEAIGEALTIVHSRVDSKHRL